MKKAICIGALVLLATACGRVRTVIDPAVDDNRTENVTVAGITATPDSTLLVLELHGLSKYSERVDSACTLMGASGRSYRLLHAAGFELGKSVRVPQTGVLPCSLVFEPLVRGERTVSFSESVSEGIRIDGIHLDRVRPPKGKQLCRIEGEVADRPYSSLLRLYLHLDGFSGRSSKYTALIPVRDGRFSCDLWIDEPDFCQLIFWDEYLDGCFADISFFAEPGTLRMKLLPQEQFLENTIEGGPLTTAWRDYIRRFVTLGDSLSRPVNDLIDRDAYLTAAAKGLYGQMDRPGCSQAERQALMKRLRKMRDSGEAYLPEFRRVDSAYRAEMRVFYLHEIAGEPSLPRYAVLAQQLEQALEYDPELSEAFEKRYAPAFPDHDLTRFCRERLAGLKVGPGSRYIDFALPDADGREHRISELMEGNELTLLEFWASWCGPCRHHAKGLIPVYERYRDKGFGVIGIANELHNADAMRKAVEKDGYPWPNLVEIDNRNHIWVRYGRSGVAGFSVLIDAAGDVVEIDPEPGQLDSLLAVRLGK